MVNFCVSVKPEFRGACEDEDELAVAVTVAAGSERTVGITSDGFVNVCGKFGITRLGMSDMIIQNESQS